MWLKVLNFQTDLTNDSNAQFLDHKDNDEPAKDDSPENDKKNEETKEEHKTGEKDKEPENEEKDK